MQSLGEALKVQILGKKLKAISTPPKERWNCRIPHSNSRNCV